jgi:hypothetical protein
MHKLINVYITCSIMFWNLSSDLKFSYWWLLQGLWLWHFLFSRLLCWTAWQCMLPLSIRQLLGRLAQGVWAQDSWWDGPSGVGWFPHVFSRGGAGIWAVASPFHCRASLWARSELFSWKTVSYSLLSVSPRQHNMWLHHSVAELYHLHMS